MTPPCWTGQSNLPIFGPDRLTPGRMAEVISDALGRPIAYRQTSLQDFAANMVQRGACEQVQGTAASG